MKFPLSGDFQDFLQQELLTDLVRSRFSGTVEIDYLDDVVRIIHLQQGALCAASSSHHQEQLDQLIAAESGPRLTKEQREDIAQRTAAGQSYGKALVEAGLMSATDLLDYNKKQAAEILARALADEPTAYRTTRSDNSNYRSLNVDVLGLIRRSILNDLPSETVQEMLGDNDTAYMTSDSGEHAGSLLEDEETAAVIRHLDGRRSIRDVAKKIGLNPDRTSRVLLYLMMMDLIEPAVGGTAIAGTGEQLQGHSGGWGTYQNRQEQQSRGGDNDDILRLLSDDDESVAVHLHTSVASPFADSGKRETKAPLPPVDDIEDLDDLDNEDSADYQEQDHGTFTRHLNRESSEQGRLSPTRFILPATAVLVVAVALFIVFTSGSNSSDTANGEELSFYPPTVQEEQLPLREEFRTSRERTTEPLTLDIEPGENAAQGQEQSADRQGTAQSDQSSESEVQQPDRSDNPVGENAADQPQRENTPPPVATERPVAQDADVETKPAEREQPERLGAQSTRRLTPPPQSWDEIQPRALEAGFLGRWPEAAKMWQGPLSAIDGSTWTIMVDSTRVPSDISSIFERFANSERMRSSFFVSRPEGSPFFVCWGFFAEKASADKAIASLPSRIRQYAPVSRQVRSIR